MSHFLHMNLVHSLGFLRSLHRSQYTRSSQVTCSSWCAGEDKWAATASLTPLPLRLPPYTLPCPHLYPWHLLRGAPVVSPSPVDIGDDEREHGGSSMSDAELVGLVDTDGNCSPLPLSYQTHCDNHVHSYGLSHTTNLLVIVADIVVITRQSTIAQCSH